jgi:hypothetical protein
MAENEVRSESDVRVAVPGLELSNEQQKVAAEVEARMAKEGVALKTGEVKIIDTTAANAALKVIPTEWNFHVYYKDRQGAIWDGDFTAKRLNNRDMTEVGVRRARMCGGVPLESLDETTATMTSMIAHFQVALKSFPTWWDPEGMYEQLLLMRVYNWLMEKELSFREGTVGK